MLRAVFSNRLFMCALIFSALVVVCGVLYLKHIEQKTAEGLTHTNERIKQLTGKLPTEAPVAEAQPIDTEK